MRQTVVHRLRMKPTMQKAPDQVGLKLHRPATQQCQRILNEVSVEFESASDLYLVDFACLDSGRAL